MQHFDSEDGGWHTDCLDTEGCKARREAAQAAHQAAHQAAADHRARVRALFEIARTSGECPPPPSVVLVGEEIPLEGSRSRIYGGGSWAVIEPEGERTAPDPGALDAARAELTVQRERLDVAQAAWKSWREANHPDYYKGVGRGKWTPPVLTPEGQALLDAVDTESAQGARWQGIVARIDALETQTFLAGHSRSIWVVRNNGHDGDAWGGNNVRTGGAGAIGHRLPWSAELEAQVRAAREPSEEDPDLAAARLAAHLEDGAREH
jgi:hypothetical protein